MDDLTPETRGLLDQARDIPVPANVEARVLQGLRTRIDAGAEPPAQHVPKTSGMSAAWWGAGAVVLVLALGYGLTREAPSPVTPVVSSPVLVSEKPQIAPPPTPPQTAPVAPRRALATPEVTPAPSTPDVPQEAPVAPEAPPEAPAPMSRLALELALMREARVALAASDFTVALEKLDRHARDFGDGVFVDERLASQVLALCELSRVDDARVKARELLRRASYGPLVEQVRASCAAP